MSDLVIFVLDDPQKCTQVLSAWLAQGVKGTTILDSTGLARQTKQHRMRDDLPLFPGLDSLLHGHEESHKTLLAVIPDDFDVDALVAATESITGALDEPDTGILFVVPVKRAWGLGRYQE